VFRATIRLDERSDADAKLKDLREKAKQAGLHEWAIEPLVSQTEQVIEPLMRQRDHFVAGKGRVNVTRELASNDYKVKVICQFGAKTSPLARLLKAIQRR
jgi:hypothetical protein